jgi:predicted phosphate transport protein (TIGR00153 family)
MKTIGSRFGINMFEQLYEHLCKGMHCAVLLRECLQLYAAGDEEMFAMRALDVSETESQADHIKLAIRNSLTPSIFAALKRNLVLQIVRNQDEICDNAEDTVKLLEVRQTAIPPAAMEEVKELMYRVEDTVSMLMAACKLLAEVPADILNTEQRTEPQHGTVIDKLELVHRKEWETDAQLHAFTKVLFEHEKETDPVSVMIAFQVARTISSIADAAENAAEQYTTLISR